MKVIVFGATGMVGQGVLRECLRAPDVTAITTVGRTQSGQLDPRLTEIMTHDFFDYTALEPNLTGFDACFFCLGMSSFRMSEADYTRVTYDLTMAAATTLARLNPQMTFVYVSGASTDSTEQGKTMWARVKGRTENALRALPFRGVYLFRPGAIESTHGEESKTPLYRALYPVLRPAFRVVKALAPNALTSTEEVGRAMLAVARHGAPNPIVEMADIRTLGRVPVAEDEHTQQAL